MFKARAEERGFHLSNNESCILNSPLTRLRGQLRFELSRNNGLPLLPAPEATCGGNSRRRSHPKRITLGRRGQSLSSTMRRWLWKSREEQRRGDRRSARRWNGDGARDEEETKKKQPSEISEMTDTRFHPVEVTTMFVSRRYAGTQATFPSRFPVKLMAATSWGPAGWLRAHGTLKTAHLLGGRGPEFSRDYYERATAGREERGTGRGGGRVADWRRHFSLFLIIDAPRDERREEVREGQGWSGAREKRRNKRRGKTDARG